MLALEPKAKVSSSTEVDSGQASDAIEHVFVLMLENRSFDHMLGFSNIKGKNAVTGEDTMIEGLQSPNDTSFNSFKGKKYDVKPGASLAMKIDPGHEFEDVLTQLCGPKALLEKGKYPVIIDSSGFVASYASFRKWTGASVKDRKASFTSLIMPESDATVTANFGAMKDTYKLTVINGLGGGDYKPGQEVTVSYVQHGEGKFKNWTGAFVKFPEDTVARLTMPASDTTVTAKDGTFNGSYTLTVVDGSGSGKYAAGQTVSIRANELPPQRVLDAAGEIMKCYTPKQLPVLVALAKEFAICDNWFSSMPGPTVPNRMFVHAASSGGLDHSPSDLRSVTQFLYGFEFDNGTIFDRLKEHEIPWRVYYDTSGSNLPLVLGLKGVHMIPGRNDTFGLKFKRYEKFGSDLNSDYGYCYTFIEPNYKLFDEYKGNSQHPLGDITLGEQLIKETYESIRNSPLWKKSLLIITWDEHGGFYDHVKPPHARPPGDTVKNGNQHNFNFNQYGPRVPAIVVSPLIQKGIIDHRTYDHASIPATLEALFNLKSMTYRDKVANTLDKLITLKTPRDTPITLATNPPGISQHSSREAIVPLTEETVSRPDDPADEGNLPAFLHAAMRADLEMSPGQQETIVARVQSIKTRRDAAAYLADVQKRAESLTEPPESGVA